MPPRRPVQRLYIHHERLSVYPQGGKANVGTLKRARILLNLDAGWLLPSEELTESHTLLCLSYAGGSWLKRGNVPITHVGLNNCLGNGILFGKLWGNKPIVWQGDHGSGKAQFQAFLVIGHGAPGGEAQQVVKGNREALRIPWTWAAGGGESIRRDDQHLIAHRTQ